MKLGEALNQRAALTQRLGEIRSRLGEVAVTVEGAEPAETVEQLLAEHDKVTEELTNLIVAINRRNFGTPVQGRQTVMEALAQRDRLRMHLHTITALLNASDIRKQYGFRYSGDVKYVRNTDVKVLRDTHKDLAKRIRELDAQIQQVNWTVDL